MALVDVGTDATTTLVGVVWPASIEDVAALNALILDDQTTGTPMASISGIGGLAYEGLLTIPNRGVSQRIYPGDVIAVDTTGFPILISAAAAAGGDWNVS